MRYLIWVPADSVLVSFRDPGSIMPDTPAFTTVLYLELWDATTTSMDGDNPIEPATEAQLEQLYSFIVENQKKSIFAHCEAGVSRSMAVREFLLRNGWTLMGSKNDPDEARRKRLDNNQERRPCHPNMHILNGLSRREREFGKLQKEI